MEDDKIDTQPLVAKNVSLCYEPCPPYISKTQVALDLAAQWGIPILRIRLGVIAPPTNICCHIE